MSRPEYRGDGFLYMPAKKGSTMPPAAKKRAAKKAAAPAKKAAAARKVVDDEELDELDEAPDSALVEPGEPVRAVYDAERETPGTMRYKERVKDKELPVTNVVYIKKTSFRDLGEPSVLTGVYVYGEIADEQWAGILELLGS